MTVYFNPISSFTTHSLFPEKVLSQLTQQQKNIIAVATIVFGFLAICYIKTRFCFKFKQFPEYGSKSDKAEIIENKTPKPQIFQIKMPKQQIFEIKMPPLKIDSYINGKVLDMPSANPLQDVNVFLLKPSSEEIIHETKTDAKGIYEFKHISSGNYRVKAEFNDFVPISSNPIEVNAGYFPVKANFSLGIPGDIIGRVIDNATNLPIANANVDVMRGNKIIDSSLTDNNGNYKVEGLAPRPYIIRVRTTYFQSKMQLVVPVPNEVIFFDFSLSDFEMESMV